MYIVIRLQQMQQHRVLESRWDEQQPVATRQRSLMQQLPDSVCFSLLLRCIHRFVYYFYF